MAETQHDDSILLQELFVYLVKTGRIKPSPMYEKALQSFSKYFAGGHPDAGAPTIDHITEDTLKAWIDTLLISRTPDTIIRYVNSLSKIYRCAVTIGIATDKTLLTKIKAYVEGLSEEGIDKRSQQQLDYITRLARFDTISSIGKAVDVVLYSFYNAGMSIKDVIELRADSDTRSTLPHAVALQQKYTKETRKYLFPLQQWQQTTNTILATIEANFRVALRMCGISVAEGKSIDEFVSESWVAVAKAAGISVPAICAICPSLLANPKLKSVQPLSLTPKEKERIKLTVANKITDMSMHWYAIRFVGDEAQVRQEIERIIGREYAKIYYPIEEIYKKTGKKVTVENRPSIRNILFIQTLAGTILAIHHRKIEEVRYTVVRGSRAETSFAIIPNSEMHRFSVIVSNGRDIIGDKDIDRCQVEKGQYVRITEGLLKGYAGRVLKITRKDNSQDTILQIEADRFGPGMKSIYGKHLNISVNAELVAHVAEIDPQQ